MVDIDTNVIKKDLAEAHKLIKRSHYLVWAIGIVAVVDFVTGAWFGSLF